MNQETQALSIRPFKCNKNQGTMTQLNDELSTSGRGDSSTRQELWMCAICLEDFFSDTHACISCQSWVHEGCLCLLRSYIEGLVSRLCLDWATVLWALLYAAPFVKVHLHVFILQTAYWCFLYCSGKSITFAVMHSSSLGWPYYIQTLLSLLNNHITTVIGQRPDLPG